MADARKPGISVLIATQNEEALVESCIRSFIDFGDELVVVDNGSRDASKDIVRQLEAEFPEKIRFFDVPELPDLHHNRQYALERSRHQWIVRADADFVAYTDGDYDIRHFREELLSRPGRWLPAAYSVPLPNVSGDFWHTGILMRPGGLQANEERRYLPPAMTKHGLRVYRHVPGFRFQRLGRWEGIRFQRAYSLAARKLDRPLWMHCNIKGDLHYLCRSERTNWRELGDFERFPTLLSYLETVIEAKYGTRDLAAAARLYVERHVLPYLEAYDPERHCPYPALVAAQMATNPMYKISETPSGRVRSGPPSEVSLSA